MEGFHKLLGYEGLLTYLRHSFFFSVLLMTYTGVTSLFTYTCSLILAWIGVVHVNFDDANIMVLFTVNPVGHSQEWVFTG